MPRRVSRIDINMFPFLSVLCSIIGVLMLFILMILGNRVIGSDQPEPVAAPQGEGQQGGVSDEELKQLQIEIARLVRELEQSQQQLQEVVSARKELREL